MTNPWGGICEERKWKPSKNKIVSKLVIRPDLARQKSVFDLPELRHNVDLILDKCEDQLISADRSLKHHKNKKEVLLEEEEKLSVLVEREKKQIKTLEDVLAEVEKLERVRTMKGNCIYLLIFICGR